MATAESQQSTPSAHSTVEESPSNDTSRFRQDLQVLIPSFVERFDAIVRGKDDVIEEYGFLYSRARHDLAIARATKVRKPSVPSVEPVKPTRSSSIWSGASLPRTTAPKEAVTTNEGHLTMRIQLRLLPVLCILKNPNRSPAARSEAKAVAQQVSQYALDNNASNPLIARCSYYVAHSHLNLNDKTPSQDALNWFQRATEASEAGYPEGQWAQEWINHYESLGYNSRPSSSSSWLRGKLNGVWSMVWGSKNISDAASSNASKPRPAPLTHLHSDNSNNNDRALLRATSGERIPSFSTQESSNSNSSTSPTSTGTKTRDHHGLKWSPNHPFGKGQITEDITFELVHSPEPIPEEDESEDEETYYPANVLGGLVDAAALSPALQHRPPLVDPNPGPRRIKRSSIDYIPPGALSGSSAASSPTARALRIANLASPPSSSTSSPTSLAQGTSFSPFSSEGSYSRSLSETFVPSSLLAGSVPAESSSGGQLDETGGEAVVAAQKWKKRNSLSLIIRATGLEGARRRDEAAQMEEGESPFNPRIEEEGLYRGNGVDGDV